MGYTTEFTGHLDITPALKPKLVAKINAFCEIRHEGKDATPVGEIWCNWQVSEDGTKIQWNGTEKAYGMFEWLQYLNSAFIGPAKSTMAGTIRAHGEENDDQWKIVATGVNGVTDLHREERSRDW